MIYYADLGSSDPCMTAVPSVGNANGADIINIQQIQSPPGVGLCLRVATGARVVPRITLPVYGVAGTSQVVILR